MIAISLCMIVKDEEAVLARCLDSVRGLFEEIIIVDTGSRDHTREIAARYTDHIYAYEWQDDFAAARNFAFSTNATHSPLWENLTVASRGYAKDGFFLRAELSKKQNQYVLPAGKHRIPGDVLPPDEGHNRPKS